MYEFLCVFGPGVLAWLTDQIYSRRFKKEETEKQDIFFKTAKIISYALVDAAVTTSIWRLVGRMPFVTLADGTRTVRYGASALIIAAVTAIVIGICAVMIEQKQYK